VLRTLRPGKIMTYEEEEDARVAELVTDEGKRCLEGAPEPLPVCFDRLNPWAVRRYIVLVTYRKNPLPKKP
jgi:hypothetical protein